MPDYSKLIELTNDVVNDYSKELVGWSLSLLGGSLFLILGTDHVKPPSRHWRSMYILFFPAWYFLIVCIHNYSKMRNKSFELNLSTNQQVQYTKCSEINDLYADQIWHFNSAVFLLSLWQEWVLWPVRIRIRELKAERKALGVLPLHWL